MKKIIFNCCNNMYQGTMRCTREWLNQQLDSQEVLSMVETYRMFKRDEDKKSLPALIPQAVFTNGRRVLSQAEPSGLLMLDIDDHDGKLAFDPRKHYEQFIMPYLHDQLSNVLMVYVTPSGCGLRVIAKRTRCSQELLAEQQELYVMLRGNLPITGLDTGCHDLTRLSFLTSREDLLYLNEEELFEGEVTEGFAGATTAVEETTTSAVPAIEKPASAAASIVEVTEAKAQIGTLPVRGEVLAQISDDGAYYGEVAYCDIVTELIIKDHLSLSKGNRNNAIYRLACQLRNICRSEEQLIKVLPYSGLSAAEVAETVHSACKSMSENDALDPILQRVIEQLSPSDKFNQAQEPAMPTELPKGIKTIISPYPVAHQPAMIMCALPMLGTLCTNMRISYLDDEVHSLSFQTVLVAEQGRGKGTMSKLHNQLLYKVIEQDDKNRSDMDDWRDEREAAGESAGARSPRLPIRNLNPKTTYPTFVDMMKNARGKHLFICAPEIDALPNNQWFQNGTTLRLAFDNERGGQDTKSVKAVSGYLPFYCNTCLSGTPSAVFRRYQNAEDGLVSRTIFCTFPDERGKERVQNKKRSEHNLRELNKLIDLLMNYGETDKSECEPVRLPKIESAVLSFYREKGDLYNMTLNDSLDVFRTRAAVIGMRAGALAWLLEGKKETKAAIAFALYVAEYTLHYQMKFFGRKLEESVTANQALLSAKTLSSNDLIFIELPDEFTNAQVTALFQARGKHGSGVSQTGRRWEENQWVERLGRGKWRKTENGKARAALLKQKFSFPSVTNGQETDATATA